MDAEREEISAPRRLPARSSSRAGSRHRPRNAVERGARVRVLDGAFSGKVGTVQELDGKGSARVMLGLLAVRIDVKSLVVHEEGRRRPVLGTSHRKPVPARS
jgi:transcription antitermination factor NusG